MAATRDRRQDLALRVPRYFRQSRVGSSRPDDGVDRAHTCDCLSRVGDPRPKALLEPKAFL